MEIGTASERILASIFEKRTGQQLSLGRRWRIDSALSAVIRTEGEQSLDQLVARLVAGREPALTEKVVEALLNNETFFFRDRLPFDLLFGGPIGRLAEARASQRRLSIWCAGCSTGQEAYSLAMTFAEDRLRWQGWTIDIVATDISRSAIAKAKEGLYSQFEVQRGLPVTQMLRWFEEAGAGAWRIAKPLRDSVRFEVASLSGPPPRPAFASTARFDVILCRNVLLYFSPEARRQAFGRLADALAPDGSFMLGAGETVIGQTDRFVSDPDHRGLYKKAESDSRISRVA